MYGGVARRLRGWHPARKQSFSLQWMGGIASSHHYFGNKNVFSFSCAAQYFWRQASIVCGRASQKGHRNDDGKTYKIRHWLLQNESCKAFSCCNTCDNYTESSVIRYYGFRLRGDTVQATSTTILEREFVLLLCLGKARNSILFYILISRTYI